MKKILSAITSLTLITALLCPMVSASVLPTSDIPIGMSNPIEMIGSVEPTIMSVTMPSSVPFSITKSTAEQNKVISPRIEIKNNSYLPVSIYVEYTQVNLNNMPSTSWSNNGTVNENQIAIGLYKETEPNKAPKDLYYAKWLYNGYQSMNVMDVIPNGSSAMYVVGTLGNSVQENKTFSVIPTFVVRSN